MNRVVKLLAINSSPRLEGNTAKLLQSFINQAEKLGAEVIKYDLYSENIPPVSGELGLKLEEPLKIQLGLLIISTP